MAVPGYLAKVSAEDMANRLVAAAQCLLPLDPVPTIDQRAAVINKLKRAFDLPDDIAMEAIKRWHARVESKSQAYL